MQQLRLPTDAVEEFLAAVRAAACPPPEPEPEPETEPEPEPEPEPEQEALLEPPELEVDFFSSDEEQTEAELMAEMTEDDQRNYRQERVEQYYRTKQWFLEVCSEPSCCVCVHVCTRTDRAHDGIQLISYPVC
jgi:hypothetical protein